jgi:hypothetical protein
MDRFTNFSDFSCRLKMLKKTFLFAELFRKMKKRSENQSIKLRNFKKSFEGVMYGLTSIVGHIYLLNALL